MFCIGVEIRPDVTELTLESGDNRTLICKGSMPVQWYFNQYNHITPILSVIIKMSLAYK